MKKVKSVLVILLAMAMMMADLQPLTAYATTDAADNTNIEYTITYHLDGGTNALKNPDVYTAEDSITLMDANKVGYDFAGWFLDSTKTEPISEIVNRAGDLELYAKYTPQKYESIFNFQGGTTSDRLTITLNDTLGTTKQYTVNSGDTFNPYQKWKLPKRDGYVFAGWEYDGTLVNNTILANQDNIELKAIWKTINYPYYQTILGTDCAFISNSGAYFNGNLGDMDQSSTSDITGYIYSRYYVYVSGEYKSINCSGYSFDNTYYSSFDNKKCRSWGGFIIENITTGQRLIHADPWEDFQDSPSYSLSNRKNYNETLLVSPGTLLRIDVYGYTTDNSYKGFYGDIFKTPVGGVRLEKGELRDSITVAYSGQRFISQEYDAAIKLPSVSKADHEFVGWYDEKGMPITDNWKYLINKTFNAKWHYSTCNGQHIYSGDCDNSCNTCQWIREPFADHKYSAPCDTVCDICDWTRKAETAHTYSYACDTVCDICDWTRKAETAHTYSNACDTECNICKQIRTTMHIYDNDCDAICNECGDERTVPAHIYDNDCDDTCNICGTTRVTDHLYDTECDVTCNKCGAIRTALHFYDDASDSICNLCGHNRAKASGKTGNCDWYVMDTTLYITGNGAMEEYTNSDSSRPWGSTITAVVIKDGVTSIGSYAFYSCRNISSVTLPNSVISIGDSAFFNCSKLSTITIPNSVTSVGSYAFYKCSDLSSVYITDLKAWCELDFADLYANPLCCADNLYLNGEKVTELIIPSGTTTVNKYAFAFLDSFFSVTIPSSVTSVGNYAFWGCDNLAIAILGDGITQIGYAAFYGCANLATVIFGDGITQIGSQAFDGCDKLKDVWYKGTSQSDISISYGNTPIIYANWHYNVDIVGEHIYDSVCDVFCNICDDMRTVKHVYDDEKDHECNECGYIAYIAGDLTGDDKINSLDGLLLMRYLNGWNVNIASPEAMDVNGDGKVNSLDGLILMRYLNGWNVTLG